MPVAPNSIISTQGINAAVGVEFTSADSTNAKAIATAGANGSIVRGIAAVGDDSAIRNVQLKIGTKLLGTVRIPALSGSDGAVVAVDLLNTTALPFLKLDAAGNAILLLPAGAVLNAAFLVAVTAAKTITLTPFLEDL